MKTYFSEFKLKATNNFGHKKCELEVILWTTSLNKYLSVNKGYEVNTNCHKASIANTNKKK